MTFISYAQNYEDLILWRALHDVERGFYVDVGAADPEIESVTRPFYERGWSGINIEPVDEYFTRLVQARPRDTNLKLVVGREAGLRIVHTFPGTGLSTLDPEIAGKNRADGYTESEIQVPMLTLKKVLEDCAPPVIHFLKIDVEGTEREVLDGLDLERVRPWIMVIEANKPNSTESNRSEWEHLITSRGYGFAYYDGLNCFYVADEAAALKARVAVPPNIFDNFMRFPEWAVRQECEGLKREVSSLRGNLHGLETALQAERAQAIYQRDAKRVAQEKLRAVEAERAGESLHKRLDDLSWRVQYLSTQLAIPSADRAIGRILHGIRETGNRLTGGGLRSLASRTLTDSLRRAKARRNISSLVGTTRGLPANAGAPTGQVASEPGPSPAPSQPDSRSSDEKAETLPVSARSTFGKLKAAISNGGGWSRAE